MIQILIYIVVILIALGLLMWLIDYIPIQQPLNRWAKIVIIVVAAIFLIGVLLNVAGVNTGLPAR